VEYAQNRGKCSEWGCPKNTGAKNQIERGKIDSNKKVDRL
jgi:hypothetical protein